MQLLAKQFLFPTLIVKLLNFIQAQGHEVTLGEAWRSPETAAIDEQEGKGIRNTLHALRLAIDLNLFKNGVWLVKEEDYQFAGVFWESLSSPGVECCWGGRWGDADHFSISYNGVK